jgi:hypothetical protein
MSMRQEKSLHPLLCLSTKLSSPTSHLWLGKICYSNFNVLCTCSKVFVSFVVRKNLKGGKEVASPSNDQDWGVEHVQGTTQAPQSIVVHEPQLEPPNIAFLARKN